MIFSLNFGEASAVKAYGDPPALLTTTSSLPCRSTIVSISPATDSASRTSHVDELVRQAFVGAARAGHDRR